MDDTSLVHYILDTLHSSPVDVWQMMADLAPVSRAAQIGCAIGAVAYHSRATGSPAVAPAVSTATRTVRELRKALFQLVPTDATAADSVAS